MSDKVEIKSENTDHPKFLEEVKIDDPIFKSYLLYIADNLPDGWIVFSRLSENELHTIGCEMIGEKGKTTPMIAMLPGWCHKNSSFVKFLLGYANQNIQTTAISPPGAEHSRPLNKKLDETGMQDYLGPFSNAVSSIINKGQEFVGLNGHSLGGLYALFIYEQMHKNASGTRKKIKFWSGINSVKPQPACKRTKTLPENEDDPIIFIPKNNLHWIFGLFGVKAPRDLKIDETEAFLELKKLSETNKIDLRNDLIPERIKDYNISTGSGLTYNFAAKLVNKEILTALQKLADEQQLTELQRLSRQLRGQQERLLDLRSPDYLDQFLKASLKAPADTIGIARIFRREPDRLIGSHDRAGEDLNYPLRWACADGNDPNERARGTIVIRNG